MQLFYDPNIQVGSHELLESEARHVVQVLRKREGDFIDLVDGKGGWYRGEIIATGKKQCLLDVSLLRQEEKRADCQVTLLFGPPKTSDRLEWLLEKATEIGVDRFQPIITEHSERRKLRPERLTKIIESAMKQSLQAWLPRLLPLEKMEQVIGLEQNEIGLMAWIDDTVNEPLIHHYPAKRDVRILIGPEGGFSNVEAMLAKSNGYHWGSLGANRLRAETAAIVMLRDIALKNQ